MDWSQDGCSGPNAGWHQTFKVACLRHDLSWRNLAVIDEAMVAVADRRRNSRSPDCHGWVAAVQVRVPPALSTVALSAARVRDTVPSRAIMSIAWPARDA